MKQVHSTTPTSNRRESSSSTTTHTDDSNRLLLIFKSLGMKVKLQLNRLSKLDHGYENNTICIKFTCASDHMRVLNEHYMQNLNTTVKDYVKTFRCELPSVDIDLIYIDIDIYSTEITKSLALFSTVSGIPIEEELLNQCVEIIDVDKVKKQVLFRMKSNIQTDNNSSNKEDEFQYLLMGKIDGTNHAFILKLNDRKWKSVSSLYEYFTPQEYKNRCINIGLDGTKNCDDSSDCGIRRVLIGCFFSSLTTSSISRYGTFSGRKEFKNFTPLKISEPIYRSNNLAILTEFVYKNPYSRAPNDINYRYTGVFDVGYYKGELKNFCSVWYRDEILENFTNSFTQVSKF